MITDDNKKLAQWAMEYALKNGCQAAKLVLYTNSNSSFELRDGKMGPFAAVYGEWFGIESLCGRTFRLFFHQSAG